VLETDSQRLAQTAASQALFPHGRQRRERPQARDCTKSMILKSSQQMALFEP